MLFLIILLNMCKVAHASLQRFISKNRDTCTTAGQQGTNKTNTSMAGKTCGHGLLLLISVHDESSPSRVYIINIDSGADM